MNTEKPERDCKRWRSIFDRDGSKEQCGHTTICPEVVWGLLDGFCRDEENGRRKIYIRKELIVQKQAGGRP